MSYPSHKDWREVARLIVSQSLIGYTSQVEEAHFLAVEKFSAVIGNYQQDIDIQIVAELSDIFPEYDIQQMWLDPADQSRIEDFLLSKNITLSD